MPSGQIDPETEQNHPVGQQDPGWQLRQGSETHGRPFGDPPQQLPSHPAVDVLEGESDIWVFIDLPGFEEEEISVRSGQNALVVVANRQRDIEDDRQVVLSERTTHVERTIPLPTSIGTNGAQASYEDGVCKVELPKAGLDHYVEVPFVSE